MVKLAKIFAVTLGLLSAMPAVAELTAVDAGPFTAASGYFPRWYQDAQGDSLELCLSKATSSRVRGGFMCTLLPTPGIFDDTKQIVFPNNFPDESFWMLAETSIDDPGNGLELEVYVAAIEAAFAAEVPRQGDQQSFARIRIRATVPVAGTYKVTHPYGVDTFQVTTPGRRAINLARDIGIGATGDFSGALKGDIGPFLRSKNGPYEETSPDTNKVETFIGDPNLQEEVTGSPVNTNFVRIDGPNGRTIETKLFNLSGKLFTGGVPTRLDVDRATYSRTAQSTWISVFARSSNEATLCYRESLALVGDPPSPCEVQMSGDSNGHFFSQSQEQTTGSLPPFVLITATDSSANTSATAQNQPLTDVVKISQARFSWPDKTLTVEASSSDELVVPSMVAEGFGRLQVSGATSTQSLVASNVLQPPATVTVKSSAGGSDTEFVVIEGRPASPINQPPVANNDSAMTTAGAPPITLYLTGNDSKENRPLTIVNLSNVNLGSREQLDSRAVIYTPPPPSQVPTTQTATFTYQVADAIGIRSDNTATVTITVQPDQPPMVMDDSATTSAGVPVTIDVLANDRDPEGSAMSVVSLAQPPAGQGAADINGSRVTYTPPASVESPFTTTFTYKAKDSAGSLSADATVTITVQANPPTNPDPINPPVANPDPVNPPVTSAGPVNSPLTVNPGSPATDTDTGAPVASTQTDNNQDSGGGGGGSFGLFGLLLAGGILWRRRVL